MRRRVRLSDNFQRNAYIPMANAVARRNSYLRQFLQALPLSPSAVAVDVGAGTLRKSDLVGSARYLATDVRHLASLDLVADATRLPLRDESVDIVLGLEVLEHVPDPRAIIREAARVLRPGGVLALSTPALFPRHSEHDYVRFTPQGLRELCLPLMSDVDVQVFGHTYEALAVLAGYYAHLALHRRLPVIDRILPMMERWGERWDRRSNWSMSPVGLHTLQCDLLLVARK